VTRFTRSVLYRAAPVLLLSLAVPSSLALLGVVIAVCITMESNPAPAQEAATAQAQPEAKPPLTKFRVKDDVVKVEDIAWIDIEHWVYLYSEPSVNINVVFKGAVRKTATLKSSAPDAARTLMAISFLHGFVPIRITKHDGRVDNLSSKSQSSGPATREAILDVLDTLNRAPAQIRDAARRGDMLGALGIAPGTEEPDESEPKPKVEPRSDAPHFETIWPTSTLDYDHMIPPSRRAEERGPKISVRNQQRPLPGGDVKPDPKPQHEEEEWVGDMEQVD
jgi:hypothetical protein